MIEQLHGTLLEKQPHRLLVLVGGMALEVGIPFSSFAALPATGASLCLLTHLVWREEGPQLYGFATPDERELFRRLIKISKVGPKLAVAILSAAPPQQLVEMILRDDVRGLAQLKGVGPKTASRLVLELREGLAELGLSAGIMPAGEGRAAVVPHEADVREALLNLGYSAREIDKALVAVRETLPAKADAETVLSAALRQFAGR